jgi:hypothetical protein
MAVKAQPSRLYSLKWPWVAAATAALGMLAALSVSGAAAGPGRDSSSPTTTSPSGLVVNLWYQWDGPGINRTNSQDYEPALDSHDAQGADDFFITSGNTWVVSQVQVDGVYYDGSGPADSANVYFYRDNGGVPGTAVFTQTNIAYTPGPNAGNLIVPLNPPAVLGAGSYWLSVQANQDSSTAGRWGWRNRRFSGAQYGAAWRNPGLGQGVGCAGWSNRATCLNTSSDPDQIFIISGVVNSPTPATPRPTGTPSPTPTPTTCLSAANYGLSSTSGSIVPGTQDIGNHCNDCTTAISLPFTYRLYDVAYDSAVVSSNGTLQFATNTTTYVNVCLPSSQLYSAIMPYWDDLRTDGAGGAAGVFTSVSGVAPNRVFNVEWRACLRDDIFTPCAAVDTNFEVRLYEGQNRFDIVYGDMMVDGYQATVGVEKTYWTQHTQYSCNTQSLSSGLQLVFSQPFCGTGTPPPASPTITPTATPTCTGDGAVSIVASLGPDDPVQTGRLYRDGAVSSCAVAKPCTLAADNGNYHYNAFTFTNNNDNDACITVSIAPSQCTTPIYSTAYLDSFDPANPCANHMADNGASGQWTYSFSAPAHARFVVVVHETQGNGVCARYTLTVSGQGCPVAGSPTATPTGTPPTATFTRTPVPTYTPTITPIVCGPNSNFAVTQAPGATMVAGVTDTGNHCNDCTTTLALPFAWTHYGVPYTIGNVSSNGNLQFGSFNTAYDNLCVPTGFNDTIFPYWDDLRTDGVGGIYTSLTGSSPNRIFNIEWRACTNNWAACTSVNTDFVLRLYEGQTRFDVIYGTIQNNGNSATIGVQRGSGGQRTILYCNSASLDPGRLVTFVQPVCTSPVATSTATSTRTRTPSSTPTITPNPDGAFAHLSPALPVTVTLGSRLSLDLMIDAQANIAAGQQSYLTFTNSLLQVVDATQPGCALTGTLAADNTTFDLVLQNQVCNGSSPCDFGTSIAPPGSIGFASGALNNAPSSGDFRVARLALCATAPGVARVHWEFSPPGPINRHSKISGTGGETLSDPGLYTDYVVTIVDPNSTPTPTSTPILRGHGTWEGRPEQPNSAQQLPISLTLRLESGGPFIDYPLQDTDASGYFTVPVGGVPNGTYYWRAKGPQYLANSGTLTLAGDPATFFEVGLLRAADANNDNVVDISDFAVLRATFGIACGGGGYDRRADFTGDCVVDAIDFNLLRTNFGLSGAPPIGGGP